MKRIAAAVVLAAVFASVALGFVAISEESDGASGTEIRLFVENADGTYAETVVDSAGSVKDVIDRGLENLGMSIAYDSSGRIESVNGVRTSNGETWNIHQYMPLGNPGWATVGFESRYDSMLISGTTYCLHTSSRSVESGSNLYESPDFKPESDGYVYIRFVYGYDDPGNPEVSKAFTPEIRKNGFWLKGTGTNMGEVLVDAMESNGFEVQTISGESGGNDLKFWITSLFGIEGDTSVGDNAWAYWSQYAYVNNEWGYNDFTLGYYDPGVYKYIAVVYIISVDMGIDTGGPLPDVRNIEILESTPDVTFRDADGGVLGTVEVQYGAQVDASSIPDPPVKEGMEFAGWASGNDDVSMQITEDTVFNATYVQTGSGKHTVSYYLDEAHTVLLHRELVESGGKAAYSAEPYMMSTRESEYTFTGWSADLSSVTQDIGVHAVFGESPHRYPVTFIGYDGTVIDEVMVDYSSGVGSVPTAPERSPDVDSVYTFKGWSSTLAGYAPVDLDTIEGSTVVYAYYEKSVRQYTVTVYYEGSVLKEISTPYGRGLGDACYTTLFDDGFAKLYSDEDLKTPFPSTRGIYGDRTLYAEKIPGEYSVNTDSGGNMTGNNVTIVHDAASASKLPEVDGIIIAADLSQLPSRYAVFSAETVRALDSALGEDALVGILTSKGLVAMKAGDMLQLCESNDGANLTFRLMNPSNNAATNNALNGLNYTDRIKAEVLAGTESVDLASEGILVMVGIRASLGEGQTSDDAAAWSISTRGAVASLKAWNAGGMTYCETDAPLFLAFGWTESAAETDEQLPDVPYGDVGYSKGGSGTEDDPYRSTLERMTLDSHRSVMWVPSALEGHPVTSIADQAFTDLKGVHHLVIPDTVVSFSLSSLLGSSVSDVYFLGDKPEFTGTLPDGITIHRASDTEGWDGYDAVTLEIGTYSIKGMSFEYYVVDGNAVLHRFLTGTDAALPATVTTGGTEYPLTIIGDSAFRDSEIRTINLPAGITDILTRAFYGADSLSRINFPSDNSLVYIWDEAFRGCTLLTTMELTDGIRFLGFESFRSCSQLRSVAIPDSVKAIGGGAFYVCENLGSVVIGTGIDGIPDRCFAYCTLLESVTLPDNIVSIGNEGFLKCYELSSIDLNRVKTIGRDAFALCSTIDSVTMGADLESLGAGAFRECSNLVSMTVYCEPPEGMDAAFDNASAIAISADPSVLAKWQEAGYNAEVIPQETPEDPAGPTGQTLLITVCLIAAFVAIAFVAIRLRR